MHVSELSQDKQNLESAIQKLTEKNKMLRGLNLEMKNQLSKIVKSSFLDAAESLKKNNEANSFISNNFVEFVNREHDYNYCSNIDVVKDNDYLA